MEVTPVHEYVDGWPGAAAVDRMGSMSELEPYTPVSAKARPPAFNSPSVKR